MKHMQHKIADYIRFGQVLLALSTILMLGLLIPNGEKEMMQLYVMIGAIVAFLGGSFFFFFRAKKIREKMDDLEQEQAQ
ncbi:YrhC family protein [Ectobacillus panaciterrae]|uniref:YrhC family protein n=1 Tax=Ectobacillus panaciterrae TaxID=363872 RepID=UPI0003F552E9|nr:YrhC family protein [Ectobacillus panaciterrae]